MLIAKEILFSNNTPDSKRAIQMMTRGYYSKYFWIGAVTGLIAPLFFILSDSGNLMFLGGSMVLISIYLTEFVRIRVPQMIPLS